MRGRTYIVIKFLREDDGYWYTLSSVNVTNSLIFEVLLFFRFELAIKSCILLLASTKLLPQLVIIIIEGLRSKVG